MTTPAPDSQQRALGTYVPAGTDQDGILMHPTAPRWAVANQTSRLIAERLTGPGGSAGAAEAFLVATYGLDPERARQDVAQVQRDLAAAGLTGPVADGSRPRFGGLFMVLTERCNLACSHCYGAYPSCGEMALETALRVVEEHIAGGGRSLTLSGGEPLLYRGLEEILTRVGQRIPVQICTNGTVLDARWAGILAKLKNPTIQISIDGPNPEVHDIIRGAGTFEKSMAAVGHLRDVGLGANIIFACTIQKPNRHALLEVAHLAAAQGVKKVRFLPLRDEGRATETWSDTGDNLDVAAYEAIFDRFLTGKEKLPQGVEVSCGLNGFTLAQGQDGDCSDQVCTVGSQMYMEPNGNAYPCAIMTEPEYRLGNIHEASLDDLVNGEVLARLHDIKLRRKSEISSCAPCQWRNFCQSGCMATAHRDKGTFWDTEDLCSYRQKAYSRAFDSILAAGIQPEQPEV